MSTEPQPLTIAQQQRLATLTQDWMTYSIDRDEPHDTHVFASLYANGRFVEEHVIDADGRCCDGDCS
jgi:hypothetical protein